MNHEPEDVLVVKEVAQLRALSHPLRIEVLKILIPEALSARELAVRLEQAPNKLHYHVSGLEDAGLIRVVGERRRGNLVERLYRSAALHFRVDRSLFGTGGDRGLEAWYGTVASAFDGALVGMRRALTAGAVGPSEAAASVVVYEVKSPSPEKISDFRARLQALVDEFCEQDEPSAAGGSGKTATLALAFYTSQNMNKQGSEGDSRASEERA